MTKTGDKGGVGELWEIFVITVFIFHFAKGA